MSDITDLLAAPLNYGPFGYIFNKLTAIFDKNTDTRIAFILFTICAVIVMSTKINQYMKRYFDKLLTIL